MIIFHYIPSLDRSSGGTAAYLQLLAKELGRLTDLHIATHPSAHPVDVVNARVHVISPSLLGGMRREWGKLLDEVRPDAVHVNCCWMPQCVLAQRLAQQKGYKVVLTPHGMLEPWIMARHYWTRKVPALWLYQKQAVRRADCLHATAESEKKNLLRLGYNDRVAVIPNGIEVEGIGLKESWRPTKKILFLSRVHVKKGADLLIEAVAALEDRMRDYEVLIAGEGERAYVDKLKRLAVRLGISQQVRFLGGVYGNKKWWLLREADVLALPTHSENFGIVIAEALACGTPVITTRGTPWRDLLGWDCGWWVKRDVEHLADALDDFRLLPEAELERMGRNARCLVEQKYSSRLMAQKMLELYREVTSK